MSLAKSLSTEQTTEIRLLIYEMLLVARNTYDTDPLMIRDPLEYDPDTPSLGLLRCIVGPFTYPDSAILRTCRTIAAEATKTLYSENKFQFPLSWSDCESDVRLQRLGNGPGCSAENLDQRFPTPMSGYKGQNIASAIKPFAFTAFLHSIGFVNAQAITSLSFCAGTCGHSAVYMPNVTELIVSYLPKLRSLKVRVVQSFKQSYYSDYHNGSNESSDAESIGSQSSHDSDGNSTSSLRADRAFWPMYRALEDFVKRVVWLKDFRYVGQRVFKARSARSGWAKLKALEQVVRKRTEL